jgi:hypothetical protein
VLAAGLLVVIAATVVVTRAIGGDDPGRGGDAARPWQRLVIQTTGLEVVVYDRDLDEQHRSGIDGLLLRRDPPVDGKVLLDGTQAGSDGTPLAAILDLATGEVEAIDLGLGTGTDAEAGIDVVTPIVGTPLVVLGQSSGSGPAFVVDLRTADVVDLVAASGNDDPLIVPTSVRATSSGSHLVFADLTESSSTLVDVATKSSTTLAGFPIDISDDRVITVTNRGDAVLVDAYDVSGERIGTVETVLLSTGMLRDDGDAIILGRDGSIHRLDFDDEDDDEVGTLADTLPALRADEIDPDDAGDEPDPARAEVSTSFPLFDRQRLVAFVEGDIAVIDAAGELVGVVRLGEGPLQITSSPRPGDRCVLVGSSEESTLVDVSTATEVFRDDLLLAYDRAADGCTLAWTDTTTRSRVHGLEVDVTIDGRLTGMSDDASTVVVVEQSGGVAVVDVDSGERTPVGSDDAVLGDLMP